MEDHAWACGTCGTERAVEHEDGTIACENGHEVIVHSGMTATIERYPREWEF